MTRDQVQQYFPDTYHFFRRAEKTHPFWVEIKKLSVEKVKQEATILPDLEQMFSVMEDVDKHHVLRGYIENISTRDELYDMLTKLYVAYIYRNHGAEIVQGEHGYDIELEIADQLLALGVVRFENFDALDIQFAEVIQDEVEHMGKFAHLNKKKEPIKNPKKSGKEFFEFLKIQAKRFTEHPEAKYQLLAAISHHHHMPHEMQLAKHLKENREEVDKHFSHMAGVVLIDPTPGSEQAKFIPFHGDDSKIELLLNKHN